MRPIPLAARRGGESDRVLSAEGGYAPLEVGFHMPSTAVPLPQGTSGILVGGRSTVCDVFFRSLVGFQPFHVVEFCRDAGERFVAQDFPCEEPILPAVEKHRLARKVVLTSGGRKFRLMDAV